MTEKKGPSHPGGFGADPKPPAKSNSSGWSGGVEKPADKPKDDEPPPADDDRLFPPQPREAAGTDWREDPVKIAHLKKYGDAGF